MQSTGTLNVTSSAFKEGEYIPSKYTCDGENINPPLHIEGLPENTKSVVLIIDDPDAPRIAWVHWIVWNIKPVADIKENSKPGVQGTNDFGRVDYGGPCPPLTMHRYFFKVYALDCTLNLHYSTRKREVESTMKDHILAKGELMGRYVRK